MDRIARSIEADPQYRMLIDIQRTDPEGTTPDAITAASRQVARTVKAAAIVCWTGSGSTGLRAAPRAAERADHRPYAHRRHRPAPRHRLGPALRRHRRRT